MHKMLIVGAIAVLLRATSAAAIEPAQVSDVVIAGGPDDFMEVRHVTLRGSDEAIGKSLTELAMRRHGFGMRPAADKLRTRLQAEYFERYFPAHRRRMDGVADALGLTSAVPRYSFESLPYGSGGAGCSVVYYPPATTADGLGVMSRNFDFTTGDWNGRRVAAGKAPLCGRPYVLELHPQGGFATLAVVCFDLLAAVDGINSKGLTVALLADDEVTEKYGADPAPGPQPGFNEIQIVRYLLETCADTAAAKAALASAKLYYTTIPCHYLIADRHGRAFIWENSPFMHHGRIVERPGRPLVTTNFLRHLHPDVGDDRASAAAAAPVCPRYAKLCARVGGPDGRLTTDDIRAAQAEVAALAPQPADPTRAVARTLWHALYCPEKRALEVDFYLGEKASDKAGIGTKPSSVRRSGYRKFTLQP